MKERMDFPFIKGRVSVPAAMGGCGAIGEFRWCKDSEKEKPLANPIPSTSINIKKEKWTATTS